MKSIPDPITSLLRRFAQEDIYGEDIYGGSHVASFSGRQQANAEQDYVNSRIVNKQPLNTAQHTQSAVFVCTF